MKVGKYTLEHYKEDGRPDCIQIDINKSCPERVGEGMGVGVEKFEKLLDQFWEQEFH